MGGQLEVTILDTLQLLENSNHTRQSSKYEVNHLKRKLIEIHGLKLVVRAYYMA